MKWNKKRIYIEDLPAIAEELQRLIKSGSPLIEDMRCVFTQEGTDARFMLMPYDFLDLEPKPAINVFYLCQVFRK